MINITDYPLLVFVLSFSAMWLSTRIGASRFGKARIQEPKVHEDSVLILTTTLTLLALIIGFTYAMATSRYDQRKNYEEEEANAIGTEYVRFDLLPAADAAKLRVLLRSYLDQRVLFYSVRDEQELRRINSRTSQLQSELWAAVAAPAAAQPTPTVALTVSGMNDVLNSQGYTQAAWWNRIPLAAWILMTVIAIGCHLMVGHAAQNARMEGRLFLVLPFVVSVTFFLIADIDSPRGGVIRVLPQNLIALAESLRPQ